ncbi:MAG: sugar ABC transporter ATP-binding protein [Candidatus Sumerlaeia bacterium]|nr:sugar ABC transporter ATP-binding protein [Candidatus Sumerlaeia bacterium]
MVNASHPVLRLAGICKRFGAVLALDGVDLDVNAGEVHALVGENGAGKSTLIHIVAGTLPPDSGEIFLAHRASHADRMPSADSVSHSPLQTGQSEHADKEPAQLRRVHFRNGHEALCAGVAAVFQELSLVGTLSVAENIFANRQPVNRWNFIRRGDLRRQTQALLDLFEIGIGPDTAVEHLSVAGRQVVEILKALSSRPRLVLFDEPTSSLTQRETQTLFSLIRRLRSEGTAIIYVSHHLPEVLELADRVTVLRDGRRVATLPRREVTERDLIRLMVGRELRDIYGEPHRVEEKQTAEPPRLRVRGLGRRGAFSDVAFDLRPGEIVGMAGLVGAGRTEVGRALFGLAPATEGEIWLDGRRIRPRSAGEAMDAGIAYVTEDRKALGLYLRHSVRDNLAAPWVSRARACTARGFSTAAGLLRDRRLDDYAETSRQRFRIVTPDVHQTVGNLSGGNQQKVLLAAWIGIEPRVLIADEPTRGVDVGARGEIYGYLRELAQKGTAILLISSDLQEILGMSDRVLVMRAGRIVETFDRAQATEEGIIAAALGASAESCLQADESVGGSGQI